MAKSYGRGRPAPSVPARPPSKGPGGVPRPSVTAAPPSPILAGPPPAARTPAGPRRLSPREAAALPSGARFVGLDGVPRVRR